MLLAVTCDQGHDYTQEQQAFDAGLMDKFPQFTGSGTGCDPGQVMGYFDGNTVTATMELRPAFRVKRQLLRYDVRAIYAGRG